MNALVDLKIIVPTADMLSIRRSMQYFLKNFQQATQREETIRVRTLLRFGGELDSDYTIAHCTGFTHLAASSYDASTG